LRRWAQPFLDFGAGEIALPFREQRATRLEDARRATYVAYLRELKHHFFLGGTPEEARALQAAVRSSPRRQFAQRQRVRSPGRTRAT
jgi:hypothetical protein